VTLTPGGSDDTAQRLPARAGHELPAAGPIADACRRTAASFAGSGPAAGPEATPGGILVRFTSSGQARQALQALRALGYQAAGEPGGTVTVTGWNYALLAARAVRLQVTVDGGEREATDWAGTAIARFLELRRAGGHADKPLIARVAGEARMTALEPCLSHRHVPAPVDDDDLRRACGQLRDLLTQVSEGEDDAAALADYAARIAETAVRLFLAERDLRGQNEKDAAAAAVRRATQIHGQPPGSSLSPYDPAVGKVRVLAGPCATCVTRKDNPFGADAEKVIRRNREAGALLICHDTLPWGPHPGTAPAACAGFFARHARDVAAGRLALRTGITRVPAPSRQAQSPDMSP